MKNDHILEIYEFTDPVCTWCWAAEAFVRALKLHYGNKLTVGYIAGGLVKDIRDFGELGGNTEAANRHLEQSWLTASEIHKMPVTTDRLELFTDEHPSSYPQNIFFKAAQFQDGQLVNALLRRIREATAVEAKQTNREEVLLALAKEVGLDTEKLLSHYLDGTAQTAFEQDLAMTQAYKVQLLPTFIVRYKGKEKVLEHPQGLTEFKQAIEEVSDGQITETAVLPTADTLLQFITTYGRVVPKEIMLGLSLDEERTMALVHELEQKKQVSLQKAGTGLYVDSML